MKLILPIVLTLLICACEKRPTERWQAERDIPAYQAVNDAPPNAPAFVIKKGEDCVAGETAYGKVDAYTKLSCKAGTGWVTESEHFKKLPAPD